MAERTDDTEAAPPARILVVDDDVELCELIADYLGRRSFTLELVHDGRLGLTRALSGDHGLILLDVMLPGLDGFTLLHQMRRQSQVPVIMLTARTGEADRVAGLEGGADDYLPKPFAPAELAARVRAVLRRTGTARPAEEVGSEGILVRPTSRSVRCDGADVPVTSIEYDILEYLVRAAGRVVTRDELTTVLYPRRSTPFDRMLDVHVSHLRKKLGAHGGSIRTVRGVGYLFGAGAPPGEKG